MNLWPFNCLYPLRDPDRPAFIYPDLDWYTSVSKREGGSPRCPYANVHHCHRYYHSLWLLGDVGITTKMQSEKILELDALWDKTDLLPVVTEHDTEITGCEGRESGYTNFCPEVAFDVFGLFASVLYRYVDEIDRNVMHSQLEEEAHTKDWRWEWAHISPLHYVKCPIYSQLLTQKVDLDKRSPVAFAEREIMEIKPSIWGVSLNVKALLTQFSKWWLRRIDK